MYTIAQTKKYRKYSNNTPRKKKEKYTQKNLNYFFHFGLMVLMIVASLIGESAPMNIFSCS